MKSHAYSTVGVGGIRNIPEIRKRKYNRTGGATVVGRIYALDDGLSTAVETVANSKGELLPAVTTQNGEEAGSALMNFITPAAGHSTAGVFVVAMEAVADNELCDVMECGVTTVTLSGTASTTVPAGAPVFATAGVTGGSGVTAQVVSIGTGAAKVIGKTLAPATYDGSNTVQSVLIHFNGYGGFR